MCHARHFLWRERNERFEEDVRRLFDRDGELRQPPEPDIERELDHEPVHEPPAHAVTAHG